MELKDLLSLLGGLALFLYGMQMMSNGLETAAGNKMKQILEKLTSNRIKAVLVGAVITAVIQSSSATTVMVVGFVNSGLMTLNQAVWIIMGANIGTTITGQLIALDIGAIAPLIAFLGVACIMFMKNEKARHISEIFAGLGVLFIGMDMMSSSMQPPRDVHGLYDKLFQPAAWNSRRRGIYRDHPVFFRIGRYFAGACRDGDDPAVQCGVYSVWSEYRNLYHSRTRFDRNKDECQTYDSDPSAVQYHRNDGIYDHMYGDAVRTADGIYHSRSGSADRQYTYGI